MSEKKQKQITPPSLIGKKLYLRPVTADDIANTYHWIVLDEPLKHSFAPLPFLTPDQAAEIFKKTGVSADSQQFLIVERKHDTPVGLASFFDLNTLNRSAQLSVVIDPDEHGKHHASEAMLVLCNHLFSYRGLNRAYLYVSALNDEMIKDLKKASFKHEGTLRQHHFFDGEYHDVFVYSMLKFEFPW